MTTASKSDYEKTLKIQTGWRDIRPDKSFAGMTYPEFSKRIEPIITARTEVATCENALKAAISKRESADKTALAVALRVVSAVKADETEGEDGELYESMGYVRKSERKSGLSRKKKKDDSSSEENKA